MKLLKVAGVALLSRLAILGILYGTRIAILGHEHHDTDHETLAWLRGDDVRAVDNTMDLVLASAAHWDAEHFVLLAAKTGPQAEHRFAFFPFYPWMVAKLAPLIDPGPRGYLLGGVLISCMSFVASTVILYVYTKDMICALRTYLRTTRGEWGEIFAEDLGGHMEGSEDAVAWITVLLFCISPVGVFSTVLYTESVFMLTQFAAHYMILISRKNAWYLVPASICGFIGTLIRSNGVLLVIPLGACMLQLFMKDTQQAKRKKEDDRGPGQSTWVWYVVQMVMWGCLLVVPILGLFGVLGHPVRIYCHDAIPYSPRTDMRDIGRNIVAFISQAISNMKRQGVVVSDHPWCFNKFPSIYEYIQSAFWDVKPFGYWRVKNTLRFIWSAPMYAVSCVTIYASLHSSLQAKSAKHGLNNPLFGPGVQLGFLTAFLIVNANIEIAARLLSAYPIIPLFVGTFSPERWVRWYAGYGVFCMTVGTGLFAAWQAWT